MPETSWSIEPAGDRIVAVGDIHGDLDALLRILTGLGLLDLQGNWLAESTDLVLTGDLNDRGRDSLGVIHCVMDLQQQAPQAGSRVHAILGNHELLVAQQDFRYVSGVEFLELEHFWHHGVNGLDAVYRGASPYAEWIRARPAILRVGSCLFVHAGIDTWALGWQPEAVNAVVGEWIAYFHGLSDEPDPRTEWLISDDANGPLWTSQFRVDADPRETGHLPGIVGQVLDKWGVERIFVGHRPTSAIDYAIGFPHPILGQQVAAIDTGICRYFGGRLSAVEVLGGEVKIHYFERGDAELELTSKTRAACKARRLAISEFE